MQCPSCAFENIPGLASCGRCGTRLDLRTADIDVTPPRARKGARAVRALVPRRGLYRMRDELRDVAHRVAGHLEKDAFVPIPGPGLSVRLLAPGWAQTYLGQTTRGRLFLAVYLALGLVAMLCWGSFLGSVALGLMFSTHVSSAVDALLAQGRVRFPAMVATTAIVGLALGLLIYAPAGWTLSHVAAIREFGREDGMFRRGDRLVVNEWAFATRAPRPGDLVLFQPPQPGRILMGPIPFARVAQVENELIDRVLAGPGDWVTWDRKTDAFTVNGLATPLRPLRPERLPERLEVRVPSGCSLILPTSSEVLNVGTPASGWLMAGCVDRNQIIAGAYLRLPLSRLWWLK